MARLCGKAKASQLFIMERQRDVFDAAIASGQLNATLVPAGEIVLKGMGPTKVCAIVPTPRRGSYGGDGGMTRSRLNRHDISRARVTALPTMSERVTALSFSGAKAGGVGADYSHTSSFYSSWIQNKPNNLSRDE